MAENIIFSNINFPFKKDIDWKYRFKKISETFVLNTSLGNNKKIDNIIFNKISTAMVLLVI